MGCATSKQPVCKNCKTPYDHSIPQSYSVHVHHPPERDGDTYHVVALTSSTLGYPLHQNRRRSEASATILNDLDDKINGSDENRNFPMEMIEAKTWSTLITEKISKVAPKTPIRTPPGEPETIDAFELMAGLEDTSLSPIRSHHRHTRSFSFSYGWNSNSNSNSIPSISDRTSSKLIENGGTFQPEIAENESSSNSDTSLLRPDTSLLSSDTSSLQQDLFDFDPDVINSFRKSLEELPPVDLFDFNSLVNEKQQQATDGKSEPLDVADGDKLNGYKFPSKDKLVVYFTSLRGVRKTYEDCCYVRVILKGLGFRLDERDVSMHSGFKEELKELLGDGFNGGGLPSVFLGKKLIGGVEEIRRMHEVGQLEKVFEGCEMLADGGGGGGIGGGVCEACGDIRFMPCETCWGSCKIYQEGDYDDDGEEEFNEGEFGFQRCPDCNENGLIRCPVCCD
ncbi:hypothetical protein LguiA_017167 [Lonicera macranthoides]